MINKKKIHTYTYLKYFPIPFLEDLVKGQVIPFIGAGFSKNADIPKGKTMPDWNKLGELVAEDLPDYEYYNPIEAISSYEQEFSRTKLIEKFNELLLTGIIKPGKAHIAFSTIPFELVCTTNFDFLIEKAYEQSHIYCRPVIDEEHLSVNNIGNRDVSLIKIHGDLHHPTRLVATEEDYDSFLNRFPMLATFLTSLLISKTCFFIGYSLDDADFRQIWQLIKDRLGNLRRQAYVISINASKQTILKYERRGVKVINIPSEDEKYSEILEGTFKELRSFWTDELSSHTIVTEERSRIQLSLHSDSYSRLCYLSVPAKHLSYYKEHIYPIIEHYNFVPITSDEFIQYGDNVLATTLSLIDKATILILDTTSRYAEMELGMIFNEKKTKENILLIQEGGTNDLEQRLQLRSPVIEKPENFITSIEDFVADFEINFRDIALNIQDNINTESQRLFEKQEYAASVISAVTLLEDELRTRLNNILSYERRPATLRNMLNLAVENEIIPKKDMNRLFQWINTRNILVHTSERNITKRRAQQIINGIHDIISIVQAS